MSMTCGPTVPPSTGSCTDLPVESSVRVTVPVVTLLPSIDAPLLLHRKKRLPIGDKIGRSAAIGKHRAWSTRHHPPRCALHQEGSGRVLSARRGVGDPAETLLA